MNSSNPLLTRWLTALRASERFAIGRECDYAQSEGDADVFDPIGLLATLAGDPDSGHESHETGWRYYPGAGGAYYAHQWAARHAASVGLTPDDLYTLVTMSDEGVPGWALANWVETRVGR